MGAEPWIPERPTPAKLRAAVQECRGCDLYRHATQAVFGEGARDAALMLVGEQPGDREDLEGHPFVGPAGRVLDRALEAAGVARDDVYMTNAVKHFKFEPRGKRRLHKKPALGEVAACKPWLDAEIRVVRPRVVLALGATAAQALLGKQFRVTKDRGKPFGSDPVVVATVHPSSILRAPDEEARRAAMETFVEDVRAAARLARASRARRSA
jgi:DNA polymerase